MCSARIGVLSHQIQNLMKELRSALPNSIFFEATTSQDLKNTEIVIADFDLLGPMLYDLPKVKFVQGTWAGLDALSPHIKPDRLPDFPILRYSGRHFGRIMSEYVIACIVNHERNILRMYENQGRKIWSREGSISIYRTIADLNVGILGIGNIGSRMGETLKALGATVLAYGRRPTVDLKELPYVTEYFSKANLQQFLEKCDYVINTLPSTEETMGLLNGSILESCKEKQAVFINVGRGSIILDDDLIKAIENKWISAGYLDVFNVEPLPADHPFWTLSQVKISPHVAAMSRAKDVAEQFSENFELYNSNKPLPTLIDFKAGY